MSKEEVYFSATEVNKFTYCNYMWYYEKNKYVVNYDKKIKNSKTKKNFKRGLKFHKKYYVRQQRNQILKKIIFLCIIIFLIVEQPEYFLQIKKSLWFYFLSIWGYFK